MPHPLRQMVITIGSPPELRGQEGRRVLAAFYGELLGMRIVSEDWLKIARPGSPFELALDGDGWSDRRPPRWRDPDHPQQAHLDLVTGDADATRRLAVSLGASLLEDLGDHQVYADPAGHPFCLWADPSRSAGDGAIVGRLVFDCFSPRSLAAFYEGLLGLSDRPEDAPERVVVSLADDRFPDFGFQHAQFVAARWPDPDYPAQLHVDLRFVDGKEAAQERAEHLGAIRLPKLADTEIYADPAAHPFCL